MSSFTRSFIYPLCATIYYFPIFVARSLNYSNVSLDWRRRYGIHAYSRAKSVRTNFCKKSTELAVESSGWNSRVIQSSFWVGYSIDFTWTWVGPRRETLVSKSRLRRYDSPIESRIGIIFSTFQGELRVQTQQVLVRPDAGENDKPRFDIDRGMCISQQRPFNILMFPTDIKTTVSPFLFLAVELPPPPLFQDSVEKNIIPQVTIHSILAKYDGNTTQVR